jgi:uncharacterized phage-associated protein
MIAESGILQKEKQDKGGGPMEKVDSTIVAVLEELGERVHRTKLVKLIYLIDELFYRHFGQTLTGLSYMWDDFGPNAIGNAVVKEADRLALKGVVHIDPYLNYYGETSYLYSLERKKPRLAGKLSETERYVIRDVVAHYGKYGIKAIVKVSKQTESFTTARQYDIIKMKKSTEYEKLIQDVKNDPDFMKGIEEALQALA